MNDLLLAGGGQNVAPIWLKAIEATSKLPENIKVSVIVAASQGYPRLTGAFTTSALTGYGIKTENILVIDGAPESEAGAETAEQKGMGITPEEQAAINSYQTRHITLAYSDRILPASKNDAQKVLTAINDTDLVIMTGGDQQRLKNLFNALPGMKQALQSGKGNKPVIAGTSAGAMVQASNMITNYQYQNDQIVKTLPAQTASGLNLLPSNLIVDTHFSEKDRAGRLASLIASTGKSGLGLDENTGVHIKDQTFIVTGTGNVYVLTPAGQSVHSPERSVDINTLPHCAHLTSNMVEVCKLKSGDHYDLATGKVTILPEPGTNRGLNL